MIDVPMPQLGESVVEGTVTKWLVREGDYVRREQPLLEVATDKADTEVVAPAAGRVARLAVSEGTIVAKGGLLCQIDETAAPSASDGNGAEASGKAAAPAPSAPSAQAASATPSTRKLAREHGVDLATIKPSGEHGRVTRDDVIRAAATAGPGLVGGPAMGSFVPPQRPQPAAPPPAPTPNPPAAAGAASELSRLVAEGGGFVPPIPGVGFGSYRVPPYVPRPGDEVIPFNRRRRITADHMVYSKVTSPHVVTVAEVDLHATSRLRELHKARFKKEGVPLTFLAFVCAATVKALRENPDLNARVLDGSYVRFRDIHLGVAVDTPGGLIVPSIKNADQLSLRGIAASIDDLASRARAGKITADDLSGTTFSVSNPGLKGNLFGAAIISQPNVGILRMGEIKKRVVVVEQDEQDTIAIHPVMFMALSYDHRVVDGVAANSFLWRVADILSRAELEI